LRIKSHKFVREAQVYRDLAGNLNIKIKQNRPIARIVHDNSEEDVYIDDEGNILPLSERFTARVIPITRSLFRPAQNKSFYQDSLGQAYLDLLKFVEKDAFWKAQLAEMQIDAKGKVIFMPQVGTQAIEFGKPEGVEQKFKKLLVFYKKVLPAMGWDRYKRVNLEFSDQIICE
jgi:cell division protein FtsQ